MYQNTFETLAVKTNLSSRQKISNEKWQEIGSFFIQSYLKKLSKTEKAIIGHIKGIIELNENEFMKFSSTRVDKPVNCEPHYNPGTSDNGYLTFNAIVSGIDQNQNIKFFQKALEQTCNVFELITDYKETENNHSHSLYRL